MKYRRITIYVWITALSFLLVSCIKDDFSKKLNDEKKVLANYIDTTYPGTQPSQSGLYYVQKIPGYGATPTYDNMVIFSYQGKTLEGNIFDTSDSTEASANKIISFSSVDGPLKISLRSFYSPGVIEGILNMREGETALLAMPYHLGFNSYSDFTPVLFNVTLLKVITDPRQFEFEQMGKYLKTLNDTLELSDSTKTDITGIYMVIDSTNRAPGVGFPNDYQTVTVNYSAALIPYEDDYFLSVPLRSIQSKEGFKVILGVDNVIKGFEGAIRRMKKGDSAKVVFPYYRGYGTAPVPNSSNQLVIPEYSTLVYDIEVTNIQ